MQFTLVGKPRGRRKNFARVAKLALRCVSVNGLLLSPLVSGDCQAIAANSKRATNRNAPGFTLKDLDGRPVNLTKYRGKVVLLDFWATWCAPCKVEIPHLVELQSKYQDRGFQVIGLSMDDEPGPVRAFYREYQINYPVAMANLSVAKSYGRILGLPVKFLIGRDGRIQAEHAGAVSLSDLEAEIAAHL